MKQTVTPLLPCRRVMYVDPLPQSFDRRCVCWEVTLPAVHCCPVTCRDALVGRGWCWSRQWSATTRPSVGL